SLPTDQRKYVASGTQDPPATLAPHAGLPTPCLLGWRGVGRAGTAFVIELSKAPRRPKRVFFNRRRILLQQHMEIDITDLEGGLAYRGQVLAVRQTYYVFEASDYFFIVSFSSRKLGGGNFNVVAKKAVRYVQRKFKGRQGLTSNAVVE